MLRTTMKLARGHVGRLVAAGVGVVVATAFVTATLLSTGLLEQTAHDAVLAGQASADVVVTGELGGPDIVEQVRAVPGVGGADGRSMTGLVLSSGGRSDYQSVSPLPRTPELRIDVSDGRYPAEPGEIMLTEPVADRLGLEIGSTVDVLVDQVSSDQTWTQRTDTVTVTGLFEDPGAGFDWSIPGLFAVPEQVADWSAEPDGEIPYVMVSAVADGVSAEQLREALASVFRDTGAVVRTAEEYAEDVIAEQLGSEVRILSVVLAAFAAVALFAAGMVIANTFAVIVAQRSRELALLRCVGATRRQLFRSVLTEAAALGLAASAAGIAVSIGLTHATVAVLGRIWDSAWLPERVDVPLAALVIPVVAGVAVTMLASVSPARAATRVSPLAALRPVPARTGRFRVSTVRWVLTAGLLLVGGALLVAAPVLSRISDTLIGLAVGVAGGAVSFAGVMVGAVMIVPPVISLLGKVAGRIGGVPAKMAAVNAVRHPRRTASTTSALLIGVTLVGMMSVGAASTRTTLDNELDERFPIDALVGQVPSGGMVGQVPSGGMVDDAGLEPGIADAVAGVDGVSAVVPLYGVGARVEQAGSAGPAAEMGVQGVDPDAAREVARYTTDLAALGPGTVVLPQFAAFDLGVEVGDRVSVTVGDRTAELDVAAVGFPEPSILMSENDLAAIAPGLAASRLWLEVEADADAAGVIRAIQDVISQAAGASGAAPVSGAVAERAAIADVVDTMLAVVIGLLAVAVVIALIGVSNTLSLSVIERSRESATLRALGLTRHQLRSMLAIEGMLVAVVGALLGVVLGLLYGWLGALTALGEVWEVALAVPWRHFVAILVVAVVAGLLASVLPGRRAARATPTAALAE